MNYDKLEKTAIAAAKKAGEYILKEFKKPDVNHISKKSKYELVTEADSEAENIILAEIKKHFPDHNIAAEESKLQDNNSEYTWHIDPIDGTTNFITKNPNFSVSIGCEHKNEMIIGVVFAPVVNDLFTAQKDQGAFLNGKKIHVSKTDKLEDSIIIFCGGHSKEAKDRIAKFYSNINDAVVSMQKIGSASIELSAVAAGRIDGCMLAGVQYWDVAAGIVILKEAGGKITTTEMKEFTKEDKYLLGSNGLLQESLKTYI